MPPKYAKHLAVLGFDPEAVLPPETCGRCECPCVVRDPRHPSTSALGWRAARYDPGACDCDCHTSARIVARFTA